MSAAELNARYEQLRRRLTGRHTPGGGDGLVVLVRQGLHAWIAHVVAAPRPRGPEAPPALASGQLAGAALDVLPHEPPPDDDPLIAAWRDPAHPAYHRAIVTPHGAFYCEQGLLEIRTKAAEACRRALLGQAVRNVVN